MSKTYSMVFSAILCVILLPLLLSLPMTIIAGSWLKGETVEALEIVGLPSPTTSAVDFEPRTLTTNGGRF